MNQATELIDQLGEISQDDFESEDEALDVIDAILAIYDVLEAVVDSAE